MSDILNTNSMAESSATETVHHQQPETAVDISRMEPTGTVAPATESKADEIAPVSESRYGIIPAEEKQEDVAPVEKVVEPISEGQLTYKGPGLLK